MTDYFESGGGQRALGVAAPIASETCREMESEVNTVAASLTSSGDVSDVRKFARQWAREHPIRHSFDSRESVLSLAAERQLPEQFSVEHTAADAMTTLDDLTRRLDVFSVQLFDQARWQADLAAMDLASQYELEKAMPLAQNAVHRPTTEWRF